jgi:hypothetical protein
MALPVSYRLKLTLFLLAFNIIGGFAEGYLLAASPFAADQLIKDQPKPWISRAKSCVIPWIELAVVQISCGPRQICSKWNPTQHEDCWFS